MTKENKKLQHKNIYEALHSAYEHTGYVQKTGKMDFGNTKYNYAGEADLIQAVRPALYDNGIMFYCLDIEEKERNTLSETRESYGKEKVVNTYVYSALYTFRFTHADSGTYIDVKAMGKGIDTGDKAEYVAATGALKYALRQTMIIETGDDPDKTSSEEQAKEKPVSIFKTAKARNEAWSKINNELANCESVEELTATWNGFKQELDDFKAFDAGGELYGKLLDKAKDMKEFFKQRDQLDQQSRTQ